MKTIEISTFFKNEFLIKQIKWLTITFIISFFIILFFQLKILSSNYQEKLDAIINLNKDEILNAIVLNDITGIEQHITLIKNEYDLDSVELIFKSKKIKSGTSFKNYYLTEYFVKNYYSRIFYNDFKTVNFKLTAFFSKTMVKKTILMATILTIIPLIFIITVTFSVFNMQKEKIKKMLIDPLILMSQSLINNDIQDKNQIKSNIDEILRLQLSINNFNLIKNQSAMAEIASQLAHDIRSPLTILTSLQDELLTLPENTRRRAQLAINRIEEIAHNLLILNKSPDTHKNDFKSEELLGLILSLITEKKIEYKRFTKIEIKHNFNQNSFGLFSKINRRELKIIISNLINNSVESFTDQSGQIIINLFCNNNTNIISIKDNGCGIPEDIQKNIFKKGFTTKKQGNGLGNFNAKSVIEKYNGSIKFTSTQNLGSEFVISLPCSEKPLLFIDSINIDNYNKIIILDDDISFHEVWVKLLYKYDPVIENYYSINDFLTKYSKLEPDTLLLCDFELMDLNHDGIGLITKLNHEKNSILITARSEEIRIKERCNKYGIKLISKELVNYIQIYSKFNLKSLENKIDKSIILIDDDFLVYLNWLNFCTINNVKIQHYKSIKSFIDNSKLFPLEISIYIDSSLEDGIKGEIESEKIFKLGFKNLFISTAFEKSEIKKPFWIKDVYSKDPSVTLTPHSIL